jgi:hypothetical protein
VNSFFDGIARDLLQKFGQTSVFVGRIVPFTSLLYKLDRLSDGTTPESWRSRKISAMQPNLSLLVKTSGCRFYFVLFGVQAHRLFRPIFHRQVENALGFLRLSGRDCVQ